MGFLAWQTKDQQPFDKDYYEHAYIGLYYIVLPPTRPLLNHPHTQGILGHLEALYLDCETLFHQPIDTN